MLQCFIISNGLYMAHHNLLVIHTSSAQNPSFLWDFQFLDPVYLYGDRKLVCLRFLSFSWKGAPSTKQKRICGSENYKVYVVSWEPEGRHCSSKMFHWEPEGCYHCTKSMAIAPFWFSMEHLWNAITPFWLSTDNVAVMGSLWKPSSNAQVSKLTNLSIVVQKHGQNQDMHGGCTRDYVRTQHKKHNFIILMGKHFILQCKYTSVIPDISWFSQSIRHYYAPEEYISKHNKSYLVHCEKMGQDSRVYWHSLIIDNLLFTCSKNGLDIDRVLDITAFKPLGLWCFTVLAFFFRHLVFSYITKESNCKLLIKTMIVMMCVMFVMFLWFDSMFKYKENNLHKARSTLRPGSRAHCGSSRVLDSLSCYLSLIVKHSEKFIKIRGGGRHVCCAPIWKRHCKVFV